MGIRVFNRKVGKKKAGDGLHNNNIRQGKKIVSGVQAGGGLAQRRKKGSNALASRSRKMWEKKKFIKRGGRKKKSEIEH